MLKVTNANVCANMVDARSLDVKASGIATADNKSCGTKARDSRWNEGDFAGDALK